MPPSDDDEFEDWAMARATQRKGKGKEKSSQASRSGSAVSEVTSELGLGSGVKVGAVLPEQSQPSRSSGSHDTPPARSPTPETLPLSFAESATPHGRFGFFSDDVESDGELELDAESEEVRIAATLLSGRSMNRDEDRDGDDEDVRGEDHGHEDEDEDLLPADDHLDHDMHLDPDPPTVTQSPVTTHPGPLTPSRISPFPTLPRPAPSPQPLGWNGTPAATPSRLAMSPGSPKSSPDVLALVSPAPPASASVRHVQGAGSPTPSPAPLRMARQSSLRPSSTPRRAHVHSMHPPSPSPVPGVAGAPASPTPTRLMRAPAHVPRHSQASSSGSLTPLPPLSPTASFHAPAPPSPSQPADHALERFRSARTFRTRTTLQLQPYTRERQIYEAALRRGGLKKGKHVVAPAREISSGEEDDGDDGDEGHAEPSSSAQADPEGIVIGTPPPRQHRHVELVDDDYDDFFVQFGKPADEEDEEDAERLQAIAKARRRNAREEKKKQKQAERDRRDFERFMAEVDPHEPRPRPVAVPKQHRQTPATSRPARSRPAKTYSRKRRASPLENISEPPPMPDSDSDLIMPELPPPFPQDNDESPMTVFSPLPQVHSDSDVDADLVMPDLPPPMPLSNGTSASSTRPPLSPFDNGSFFVNDVDADSDSGSDSDSHPAPLQDKRARIARRMLPGALLKRLEREAAEKAKQKAKHRERQLDSPSRPGKAVVRRGGNVTFDDVVDLVASQESEPFFRQSSRSPSPGSGAAPIIVDSDSSSQAGEDNGPETLARLYEGDYESIVAPRKPLRKRVAKPYRPRRPVLGFRPLSSGNRAFVQTKLDFPRETPRKPGKASKPSKGKRKRPGETARRPAIRLDDHVIFADGEFAFSDDERRSSPVDSGVGKARSWANFEKFPIDFEITPLPSGLYCDPTSSIINRLGHAPLPEPCSAYGIEFTPDMDAEAIRSVVPIYFDAVHQALLNATEPQLDPLNILVAFPYDLYRQEILDFSSRLEEMIPQKLTRDALLTIRWRLLQLASPLDTVELAARLMRALLDFGFDKTIRPLKRILRGESETAEISELSTILWIAMIHALTPDAFVAALSRTLDTPVDVGPMVAERLWFLVFGLCALSQFGPDGRVADFHPSPRWWLVRRAVSPIKVSHDEHAESNARVEQLQGRDRYIKAMMARCVRLSAVWKWSFDRESFTVATKDLGVIFKDRHHRNLPTEPPVDYPDFITRFDMSRTAVEDTKRETAFELYLRLVCVAASDIISRAESLSEAQQAEKDVQRLIMSIIPVSPVKFNRIFPPTPRQLGQLINRYSTMIAACYFSPALLPWLLANSKKWAPFESADFDSRQITIRGLMYLAVACRHHHHPLDQVVARLAEILSTLQHELPSAPSHSSRVEVQRTMVLVVSCFRQIIQHHSFDASSEPAYPDPTLLHDSESDSDVVC